MTHRSRVAQRIPFGLGGRPKLLQSTFPRSRAFAFYYSACSDLNACRSVGFPTDGLLPNQHSLFQIRKFGALRHRQQISKHSVRERLCDGCASGVRYEWQEAETGAESAAVHLAA